MFSLKNGQLAVILLRYNPFIVTEKYLEIVKINFKH